MKKAVVETPVRKKAINKHLLLDAGITEDYHHIKLSEYTGPRLWKKRVNNYINNLAQMRKTGMSFLFYGTNNTGKTTLAMILAKAYLINGYSVTVTSLREMTDTYCSSWTDRSAIIDIDRRIKNCDFLVIDDLNKEFQNRMTTAVLDEVLRHRSNRLLPFAITTNLAKEQLLEIYGPSFVALLERRAVECEFKNNLPNSEALIKKNLALLDSLDH